MSNRTITLILAGGLALSGCAGTPQRVAGTNPEFGCIAGSVGGAVLGGLVGATIGSGTGQLVAVGTGVALGGAAGTVLTCR
ncbi:hypothetical protein PYH37_004545 [Sinorhizobium numidicum]|uniref:17 kDa surface antigen n=1 Tax=Sinorhizobium numidicum TaxID=680248 RepID=A0ABY8CXT5_9HYPH|nr:hypothetical protein [Sinorhizobium numidicum]WEX76252.1 hypothetical protein PYH37_004545 [Sinorhizobium numidicum]WEX82912.1 hypothetical protein PYH38_005257 [Sinorhizobium numidicum]